MRLLKFACSALLLSASLAACADERPPITSEKPDIPKLPPNPVGVYSIAVHGIGTEQMSSTITVAQPETGASTSLTPIGAGIVFEQIASSSFTEGTRTTGGQRYVSFTYRVRNGTGVPLNNLTLLLVTKAGTISGTALSSLKRFDGTAASSSIAPKVIPTGMVGMMEDGVTMQALHPDVIQVFTEAEVAAIVPPAGVTGIFPVGYMVRSKNSSANRSLPVPTSPNQFDGLLTVSFRLPLQSSATLDVFSFFFEVLGVTDTETKLTESIEESQDSAAVRRLRERATSLGATTVTVMNGSPAADPFVTDYPGQRQICSARVAGPSGSPVSTTVEVGAYSLIAVHRPGQSLSACGPYFISGAASPANYGLPYPFTVRAMDRYGNVRSLADTVSITSTDGTAVMPGPAALVGGSAVLNATYTTYGGSTLTATGRRLVGRTPVTMSGMTRTWSGNVGTDWATNGNWVEMVAPGVQDSVIIPGDRPNYPLMVSNLTTAGITMTSGASSQPFINTSSFDLTVNGNMAFGTTGFLSGTGRLILAGVSGTVGGGLANVDMRHMRVTGSYSATSNLNVTGGRIVVQGGRLRSSGFRVRVRP